MASRIQVKSPAGVPAPDVPRELPEAAVTGPWPVVPGAAAGARARARGDPGKGAPLVADGSPGIACAVPSGGFATVDEADRAGGFATAGGPVRACGTATEGESGRAGGTGRTAAPGGSAAATMAGGTGRGSISAGGRRVRSITRGAGFGGAESATITAAPTKRCSRRDAPAPFQAALPVQPRGTGMLSCCPIIAPVPCRSSSNCLIHLRAQEEQERRGGEGEPRADAERHGGPIGIPQEAEEDARGEGADAGD